MQDLKTTLQHLREFERLENFRSVLAIEPLHVYHAHVPLDAQSSAELAERWIVFLLNQHDIEGQAPLALFLQRLIEMRTPEADAHEYSKLCEALHKVQQALMQVSFAAPDIVEVGFGAADARRPVSEQVLQVNRDNLNIVVPRTRRQWVTPREKDTRALWSGAVGRKDDLHLLSQRLCEHAPNRQPRAAIVGMPGVGKSTLASIFVHQYRDMFAGVLWESISYQFEMDNCNTILNRWAAFACGGDLSAVLAEQQAQSIQFEPSAVYELLADHSPLLIVLDDIWNLDVVQPLLEAIPADSSLLITTRDHRIGDELGAHSLERLTQDESLALLHQEIRNQDKPLQALDEFTLRRLAEGVQHHPQMLKIAARTIGAHMSRDRRLQAVDHLLRRIYSGQELLPQQPDQPVAMHLCIDQVIGFSYEDLRAAIDQGQAYPGLGSEYQHRFRLLGVLGVMQDDKETEPDSAQKIDINFSTAAAAALWQIDIAEAVEVLELFANRSLLTLHENEGAALALPDSQGHAQRWNMHALIWNYAHRRLQEAAEFEAAFERYLAYVLALATYTLHYPVHQWGSLLLDLLHLKSVGIHLARQAEHLMGCHPDTGGAAHPSGLPLAADEWPAEQHTILTRSLSFALHMRPFVLNLPDIGSAGGLWLRLGLMSARVLHDTQSSLLLSDGLGDWHAAQGELDAALEYYETLQTLAQEQHIPVWEASALHSMGQALWLQSNPQQSLERYRAALMIARKEGIRNVEGYVLNSLGMVYDTIGNSQRAHELYEQALPIFQELEDLNGLVRVQTNLGQFYQTGGDPESALNYFNHALEIATHLGDQPMQAIVLSNAGVIYSSVGDLQTSLHYLDQSLVLVQSGNSRHAEGSVLNQLGLVYFRTGQLDEALHSFTEAIQCVRESGQYVSEGLILQNRAMVYEQLGQRAKAIAELEQVLSMVQQTNNRSTEGLVLYNLGSLHLEENLDVALDYFEHAIPLLREANRRTEEVIAICYAIGLRAYQGDSTGAQQFIYSLLEDQPERVTGMTVQLVTALFQPEHSTSGGLILANTEAFEHVASAAERLFAATSWEEIRQQLGDPQSPLVQPAAMHQETNQGDFVAATLAFFRGTMLAIGHHDAIRVFDIFEHLIRQVHQNPSRLDEIIRAAEQDHRTNPALHWWWGCLFRQRNAHDQAIAAFNRALDVSEQKAPYLYERGWTHRLRGDFAAALADLNEALSEEPDGDVLAHCYHYRGAVFFDQGQMEAARNDQSRVTDLSVLLEMSAFQQRALAAYGAGDIDAATRDFQHVLSWQSAPADTLYWLALIALHQQDLSTAQNYLDAAIGRAPVVIHKADIAFWRGVSIALHTGFPNAAPEWDIARSYATDVPVVEPCLEARIDLLIGTGELASGRYHDLLEGSRMVLPKLRLEVLVLDQLVQLFPEYEALRQAAAWLRQGLDACIADTALPPVALPPPPPRQEPRPALQEPTPAAVQPVPEPTQTTTPLPTPPPAPVTDVPVSRFDLATHEAMAAESRRALDTLQQHTPSDTEAVATHLDQLASQVSISGDSREATRLLHQSLALRQRMAGLNHPISASTQRRLGDCLSMSGRYTEADRCYREALLIYDFNALGSQTDMVDSLNSVAVLAQCRGDYARAALLLLQARELNQRTQPAHQWLQWKIANNLAFVPFWQHNLPAAFSGLKPIAAASTPAAARLEPGLLHTNRMTLAYCQYQFDEAVQHGSHAVQELQAVVPPHHPAMFPALNNLARCKAAVGDREAAQTLCHQAHDVLAHDGATLPALRQISYSAMSVLALALGSERTFEHHFAQLRSLAADPAADVALVATEQVIRRIEQIQDRNDPARIAINMLSRVSVARSGAETAPPSPHQLCLPWVVAGMMTPILYWVPYLADADDGRLGTSEREKEMG
jgi:tetratricopeptide (TPR) repeat protein